MPRIIFRCGIEKARLMLVCVCVAQFLAALSATAGDKADWTVRPACRTLRYPAVCELCMASECHIHTKVILFCECVCVSADGEHTHTLQIYPRRGAAPRKLDFTLDVCAAGEQ